MTSGSSLGNCIHSFPEGPTSSEWFTTSKIAPLLVVTWMSIFKNAWLSCCTVHTTWATQGLLPFRQPKSLEHCGQKQPFILHEKKKKDIMGKSTEKTQICKSEGSHPKMSACLLKCEFCRLLSNVSFLILTSTGRLILAFLASLSMERAPNKRLRFLCYEVFNQPVQHRSVTVVKMHGTCKPTCGLNIMEETPEQPHRKYQLHGF